MVAETPRHTRVTLAVEPELARAYHAPGQVLRFRRTDDEPVYLALCSRPGDPSWEVLLGEDAVAALGWQPGQRLELEPPVGRGFTLEPADGRDVLLFAIGSGLAPLRPLIQELREDRSRFGWVRLYVGARDVAGFPFEREFAEWAFDRIDIHRSVSRPWVHHRFAADPPDVSDAVAYVCGTDEMMTDVTNALVQAGMAPDRIQRNW